MKTTRKVDKREQHIKKKLTAAILMLLISSIMTVTSTYAWFTLSTAPEVTGIQTTIGGNGNLEIALANGETWMTPANINDMLNGVEASPAEKNVTWGNLVDVSDGYGVNLLSLSPSALDILDTNGFRMPFGLDMIGKSLSDHWLKAPKYGVDGRVSELAVTMNATYTNGGFTQTTAAQDANEEDRLAALLDNNGLRAFGISSKMTARQTAFMSSKALASTKTNAARSGTSNAMETGGSTLGSIAIKIALSSSPSTEKFSQTDWDALNNMLLGTQTAVRNLDDALISFIDAAVASNYGQNKNIDDTTYQLISSALEGYDIGNESQIVVNGTDPDYTVTFVYGENMNFNVDGETGKLLGSVINKYREIDKTIADAIDAMPEDTDNDGFYLWGDGFNAVVGYMMDMNSENITVGNYTINEIKQMKADNNLSPIISMLDNLVINLGPDSSVFYDISTLAGRIQAGVKVSAQVGAMSANVDATIRTTNSVSLITNAVNALTAPTSEGSSEADSISDIYAYALDLIFRTNATNSNLLLQTVPVDRIYENNSADLETMGGGSTMTFTKSITSFTNEQMLNLMDSIRIVFIDNENTVLALAGLDTADEAYYEIAAAAETPTHAKVGDTYVELEPTYIADSTATDGYRQATETETPTHALYQENYVLVEYVEKLRTNYQIDDTTGAITANIRIIHSIDADTKTVTFVTENMTENVPVTDESGNIVYREAGADETATHKYDETAQKYIEVTEGATHVVSTEVASVQPEICELAANEPKCVSVLVYLDGDTVSNSDVANAASSMSGTMNLQFASSAELVPMEYSGLHIPTTTETPDASGN